MTQYGRNRKNPPVHAGGYMGVATTLTGGAMKLFAEWDITDDPEALEDMRRLAEMENYHVTY